MVGVILPSMAPTADLLDRITINKQRLDHLVEMVAIKALGRRAQRADEPHRADKPAGVKSEHDED